MYLTPLNHFWSGLLEYNLKCLFVNFWCNIMVQNCYLHVTRDEICYDLARHASKCKYTNILDEYRRNVHIYSIASCATEHTPKTHTVNQPRCWCFFSHMHILFSVRSEPRCALTFPKQIPKRPLRRISIPCGCNYSNTHTHRRQVLTINM